MVRSCSLPPVLSYILKTENMNIISGDQLKSILHDSEFTLNSYYKGFDAELADKPGQYVLQFDFPTSKSLAGTGLPYDGYIHTAVLKREVRKRAGLLWGGKRYLEFEVISDDADEFDPTKFYVLPEELIPVLLGATEGEGETHFNIEYLADTVGLVGNEAVSRQLTAANKRGVKKKGV